MKEDRTYEQIKSWYTSWKENNYEFGEPKEEMNTVVAHIEPTEETFTSFWKHDEAVKMIQETESRNNSKQVEEEAGLLKYLSLCCFCVYVISTWLCNN